jgi:hypothetical protein
MLAMFKVIGNYVNHELVLAKFIRSLFYIYKDQAEIEKQQKFESNISKPWEYKGIDDLKCIKFKFRDKFSIDYYLRYMCCRGKRNQ